MANKTNYLIIFEDVADASGCQSRGFAVYGHDLVEHGQRSGPWTAREELDAQVLAEELQRRLGLAITPLPDAAGVGIFTGGVVQPTSGCALAGDWGEAREEIGDLHQAASLCGVDEDGGRITPSGHSALSGQCSENQRSAR
jgi:hypothetical protein